MTEEYRAFALLKHKLRCEPERLDTIFKNALEWIEFDYDIPTLKQLCTCQDPEQKFVNYMYEHNGLMYNAQVKHGRETDRDPHGNKIRTRFLQFSVANSDYVYADLRAQVSMCSLKPIGERTRESLLHQNCVGWDVVVDIDFQRIPALEKFYSEWFIDHKDAVRFEMLYNAENERVDIIFSTDVRDSESGKDYFVKLVVCFENRYPEMVRPNQFGKIIKQSIDHPS